MSILKDLIITVISDDRLGIVEIVAETVSQYQGNWLESRLTQLGGKFAGVVRIQLASGQVQALTQALLGLREQGIQIVVEAVDSPEGPPLTDTAFHVLGPDRPGIVKELTHTFAHHNINVKELDTRFTSMPYSGEPLFEARGNLHIPPGIEIHEIEEKLEVIANALAVDISLKVLDL